MVEDPVLAWLDLFCVINVYVIKRKARAAVVHHLQRAQWESTAHAFGQYREPLREFSHLHRWPHQLDESAPLADIIELQEERRQFGVRYAG